MDGNLKTFPVINVKTVIDERNAERTHLEPAKTRSIGELSETHPLASERLNLFTPPEERRSIRSTYCVDTVHRPRTAHA